MSITALKGGDMPMLQRYPGLNYIILDDTGLLFFLSCCDLKEHLTQNDNVLVIYMPLINGFAIRGVNRISAGQGGAGGERGERVLFFYYLTETPSTVGIPEVFCALKSSPTPFINTELTGQ